MFVCVHLADHTSNLTMGQLWSSFIIHECAAHFSYFNFLVNIWWDIPQYGQIKVHLSYRCCCLVTSTSSMQISSVSQRRFIIMNYDNIMEVYQALENTVKM